MAQNGVVVVWGVYVDGELQGAETGLFCEEGRERAHRMEVCVQPSAIGWVGCITGRGVWI